ncbi:MAG: hypothetical protein HY897_08515 [Deltaproteobacteria bacterium]|nr:hypothetical protein [Deltaproteobacteria bacterium]
MATSSRRILGDPLNFKSLSRAPVSELGVVYLFGMLHDVFGFKIESIQARFPDCIACRKIGEGRWEELRIEFEFESKTFHAHRHNPSGVDVIVCWKHNWPQCPKQIEIIELSSLVHNAEALSRAIHDKRKPLSAWQTFSRKHRLAGRSFAEISKLWKEQKRQDVLVFRSTSRRHV